MEFLYKKQCLPIAVILFLSIFKNVAFSADATLIWNPNSESDLAGYKVYYGTSSRNYGAPINVGNKTTHTITGLVDNQSYYFAVTAYDTSGNESGFSNEVNKGFADSTPPTLTGITTSGMTTTAVTISWNTSEPATSQVEYGTTTAYGASSPLNTTLTTSHSRSLNGLTPATLYHYRVVSKDATGNTATSGDNIFTTTTPPDTIPPRISGITASNISSTSAVITWTTNEPSDSLVKYGVTSNYNFFTLLDANRVTSHSRTLTNLSPSTTYHFQVVNKDAAGNQAISGNNFFTTVTPPDTTLPVISGITASNISSTSAVITWTTNEPSDTLVKYGVTSNYGSSTPLDATRVASHSRTLTGLRPLTTYHFQVVSKDAAGNQAVSGNNTFITTTTPDITPPVISRITTGGITSRTATITWSTGEAATSQVEYGTTTAYGASSSPNTTLTTTHGRSLSGLTPSTTYHYRVVSKDAAGNTARSENNTFTTTAPPPPDDLTGPDLSGITVKEITPNGATITWGTDEPATAEVEYGLSTDYGESTDTNATLLNGHRVTLVDLKPDTLYHYRVKSADAVGNLSLSADGTFVTAKPLEDGTPPEDVKEFKALSGIRQVTLSWINPPDPDFVGVRIVYRTDRFPKDLDDGESLGDFTGEPNGAITTLHTTLTGGLTYFYIASSYDNHGNFQHTARASAIPIGFSNDNSSDPVGGATGGCTAVTAPGGNPPGPMEAADLWTIVGLVCVLLIRKKEKTEKMK
ncbi:MAG: fibronectin type III domain-containing protein [Candidatus Manganitrophaceae bacterium]